MSEDCIFCQILSGAAPSFKVYEDEDTYAFMDIFPMGDGHVLIIPKLHGTNLFELPEEALLAVSRTARRLGLAIKQSLNPDGLMVAQLNGAAAGQTVFHYHMHLIPRSQGDPITLQSRGRAVDEHLQEQAALIAECIDSA